MIRLVTDGFGWIADASGERLTLRTNRAREIAETADKDKRYRVEIKEYRPRRSRNQNDMYWAILTQMARKLNILNNRCHNLMLRRYGSPKMIDGFVAYTVLPDTDETEEKLLEEEDYHLKPTAETRVGNDGLVYRTYMLMNFSRKMDTSEFARLMDGLLDEAHQIGIDTEWRFDE